MNYLQDLAARIKDEIPQKELPDGDLESLFRGYAVLLQAKGADVTRRDVHDAWVAWMSKVDPSHDSLVPFEELSPDTQAEDSVFVSAIKSVAINRS